MSRLIKKLLFSIFILFSINSLSQTVSISNMKYSPQNIVIPDGGTIEIPENSSQSIDFLLSLTNPSGVEGTLRVLRIRDYNDYPITLHQQIVQSGSTNLILPLNVVLFANYFYQTGGFIYAEFETIGGLVYISNSYSVEIIPSSGGGNDPYILFNISCTSSSVPPITYNQIVPGQYVYPNQSINTINGTNPQGGTGFYYYGWKKRASNSSPWQNIPNSNMKNYTPPSNTTNGTQFQRLVISGDIFGNPTNCIRDWSNIHTVHIISNSTDNIIYANELNINPGESVEIYGNEIPSFSRYSWGKSEDNNYWYGGRWLCTQLPHTLCSEVIYQTTFYVRGVTFHDGTTLGSNTVKINVNLVNNEINLIPSICKLEGSTPQGAYGSGSYIYQWHTKLYTEVNWIQIPNATSKDYFPDTCSPQEARQYRRSVYSSLGGSSMLESLGNISNVITISPISIGPKNNILNNNAYELILFPNPTIDKKINFIYSSNEKNNSYIKIYIFDLNGNIVYSNESNNNKKIIKEEIPLLNLKKGIYFFVLENSDTKLTKQLIIN